jgi:hypothetical protein
MLYQFELLKKDFKGNDGIISRFFPRIFRGDGLFRDCGKGLSLRTGFCNFLTF